MKEEGYLIEVKHWSTSTKCEMSFNIYLPTKDKVKYPLIYFLCGRTGNNNSVPRYSNFASHAFKHKIAVVFPDTSPRNLPSPYI